MPLRRKGDKPLSEAMMVELTDTPSHIYFMRQYDRSCQFDGCCYTCADQNWRTYLVTFPLVTIHGTKSR